MTNRTGAGRPNKATYVTSYGETIHGAYKGKDGKLRPIGRSKPTFALTDEARAIHKFRLWQTQQGEYVDPKAERIQQHVDSFNGKTAWRRYYRDLILTDPKQAAIDLDIPHLAFHPAMPDKPQYTLAELGETYLKNARNKQGKPLDRKNAKNSKVWWTEFCDFVKVTYPRDLTKEILSDYQAMIHNGKTSKGKPFAPATIRCRLVKIKAIFSWSLKKTDDVEALRKALDLCNHVFDLPQVESNPCPMSPEHFRAVLAHANTRMKAVLLLGLNAAMHNGEIGETLKSDLNLDKQTLAARRGKNRNTRVAWLWSRTVEAIRAYQKAKNTKSDLLFVSAHGNGLSGESIRQLFVTLRKKAEVPKHVTMEGLRDAAYGIAENVDPHFAKYLAGHKSGMNDKYVLRQADSPKIRACCEAIEAHFFGAK